MKEIKLTGMKDKKKGIIVGVTIVDDDDYEKYGKLKWNLHQKYVSNKQGLLHRQIMGVTDVKIAVHHINGNKLDNRKENLQVMTRSEHATLENNTVGRKRAYGNKSHTGRIFSLSHRMNISKGSKGRVFSEEHKHNQSIAAKIAWENRKAMERYCN